MGSPLDADGGAESRNDDSRASLTKYHKLVDLMEDSQPRERCVRFAGWDSRASSDCLLNSTANSITAECAPASGIQQESRGTISRLPPEILCDIFLQNVLQLPTQRGRYYGLFNFLFVCWGWHSVARCSPHLWCHLGRNINHWPVFVALSKGMDLFVHMYDVYAEYRTVPDDHLNAMFRDHDFYSRIREFTLDGRVDVLSHIFPEDTPRPSRLDSLSITNLVVVSSSRPADPSIPKLLVESSSESLRRLSISACVPDIGQLPIVRQLTHLSLTDFNLPHLAMHPTLKQLLLVLQANPDLEELLLDYGGCGLQADDDEDLPFVFFTRLRKLRTRLRAHDVAPLLQYIRIVSEVQEIELKVEEIGSHEVSEAVSSWLDSAVSPHVVQCIGARPVSYMSRPGVKYVRSSDSIQHPTLPHHSCFVELTFHGQFELSAFLALETLRNATRLELFHDDLPASRYLEIFEMAPMLQELVTWVGQECNPVRALLPATQDSQEDVGENTCSPCVPLRNLSHLRIIEADLRDTEDEDSPPNEAVILNLVRHRKILGFGLERVEFVCCECVSPDWVDELRQFVPDVFWDGRGGVGEDDSDEDYYPPSSDPDDSDSGDSGGDTNPYDSDKDSYALSSRLEDSDSDEGETASSESTGWVLRRESW